MKHTIKNSSDTKRIVTITAEAADLAPIKQKTLARLAKNVKVAGFRQGKVPATVAEKNINQQVLESEVLEDAVNAFAIAALEKEGIMPLDRPKVEVKKFIPGQELEFTAELEVVPAITLGDYKKLKAPKEKVVISDKDVAEVIERLQRSAATKQDVQLAAKNGDEVTIDFAGTDKDGNEVPGATGKDYPLTLGSNSFIPGFEEGLVGAKPGDKLSLKLTFPKEYHHKPLAGAKVTFAVTVNKVNQVVLPKLDDDFAKKSGAFQTVADLKADIKKELTAQKEQEAADKQKDLLIEQLVKASKVPTPEVLVHDQIESLERDFTQNLLYRGLTLDQYLEQEGKTKEEWREKDLHDSAVRRVQVGLVLSELSKAEKIDVTHEELETRLAQLLAGYGNDANIAKQLDTPEARRDLANRVMTEKTVERLVELNA